MADTLNAQILKAHEIGDKHVLVALYTNAADTAINVDVQAFFLTYAHVYALELGHPEQPALMARLHALGRE